MTVQVSRHREAEPFTRLIWEDYLTAVNMQKWTGDQTVISKKNEMILNYKNSKTAVS